MGNVSSGSRDEDSKSSVSMHYPSNVSNNGGSNSNSSSPSNSGRKFSRGRMNFLTGTNQVAVTTMTNSNQVAETPRSGDPLNTSRSNSPLMIGTSSSSSNNNNINYHHQPSTSNGSSGTFVHHQYSSSGGSTFHHHTSSMISSSSSDHTIIPIQLQSVESLQLITELYYSVYLPHDWKVQLLQYGSSNSNNISNYSPQQQQLNNVNNSNNNNNINISQSPPSSSSSSSSSSPSSASLQPPTPVNTNSLTNSPANNNQLSTTQVNSQQQNGATTTTSNTNNNIQQKIFFSSYDRNFEKDFLEIYVTFSPHSIEKEAQLAIEDIQELSRNYDSSNSCSSSGGNNNLHRTPSSSMMRQVSVVAASPSPSSPSSSSSSSHSTMLEPKLVKGITHVVDKHIQPEKKALYFIIQFHHELLPQKLLYKKIYFIQDSNGLLYCLMLTTTRRESENILGYSLNLTVPTKGLLIPSINIQQELFNNGNGTPPTSTNHDDISKLTVSPPSSNRNSGNLSRSSSNTSGLVDSVDKTADCTSPNNDIISKRKNSNTIAQNNSKKMKKRLSAAFSSIGGSMFEDEDAAEIFSSNLVYSNNNIPPIDGAAWIDILVKEFFTVKSISDLKRKTSNLDGDGIVLSVPMCFIPSLRIEADACSGEDEMVRHFGVGDFGKRSQDYKLILYHPIQYLANKNPNQTRSRETLENVFVTYVNFGNTTYKNRIEDYGAQASNFTGVSMENSGSLLEQFYSTTFKEQVLKTCTIVSVKNVDYEVSLYSQQSNSEVDSTEGEVPTLKAKIVELASTTYSGHTLKKVCYLVERNARVWIFTYTSTSNLIAREIFEVMMSEVKYYKLV
ncbi:predicted protein [Naegleria gruberi]|uniref:Predicted protein n=1 Tax=Naegleria gruberi TaxID=5762 RepID=D2VDC4_NAEGR|nr:uncharacterized protein NAEGRDRAFT_79491 [Naegleria gruberi]EFC45207.1 predicted protein [Naegleria gruberi]|eukprot:XP_002677951.1 predicted protein [Naegleria gruberi strain NEG-M]